MEAGVEGGGEEIPLVEAREGGVVEAEDEVTAGGQVEAALEGGPLGNLAVVEEEGAVLGDRVSGAVGRVDALEVLVLALVEDEVVEELVGQDHLQEGVPEDPRGRPEAQGVVRGQSPEGTLRGQLQGL